MTEKQQNTERLCRGTETKMKSMWYRHLFAVSLLLLVTGSVSFLMPLHASCKIQWAWSKPCDFVMSALVNQVSTWNNTNCGSGEKCRYALVSRTATELQTTHTTPVKQYVDDQTFTFKSTSTAGCNVEGSSTSETWYAVLDYGTNYCNLHNLVTGAGLDKQSGYSETTDNSVCTQFSSADCEKY